MVQIINHNSDPNSPGHRRGILELKPKEPESVRLLRTQLQLEKNHNQTRLLALWSITVHTLLLPLTLLLEIGKELRWFYRRRNQILQTRQKNNTPGASSIPHSLKHPDAPMLHRMRTLDLKIAAHQSPLQYRPDHAQRAMQQRGHNLQHSPGNADTITPMPQHLQPSTSDKYKTNSAPAFLPPRLLHFPVIRRFGWPGVLSVVVFILIIGTLLYRFLITTYQKTYADAMTASDHLHLAQLALQEQRFDDARFEFLTAKNSFEGALQNIKSNLSLTMIPIVSSRVNAGETVLQVGQIISQTGYDLTSALQPVTDIMKGKDSSQVQTQTSMADYTTLAMKTLALARPKFQNSLADLKYALILLNRVNMQDLDGNLRDQLNGNKDKLGKLIDLMSQTESLSEVLPELLGANGARDYLLLFQNTAEKRPTGGFIGSYGIISFDQGKLSNFFTDNVYNPDGQLNVKGIINVPPLPLQRITPNWAMRDGNWSPDYPTSANQIKEFYQQGSNREVNGVIAVTPDLIQQIMQLVGPIYLSNWNEIVTADNIIPLIQYKVDIQFKNAPDPKMFLIDLSKVLFDKIMSLTPEDWPKLMTIINTSLKDKLILMWSPNATVASWLQSSNFDGRTKAWDGDYLQINTANIGGTKSSQFVNESYKLMTNINANGEIENTVTITYQHTGNYDWPSGPLIAYQRIYVPKGSQLLETSDNHQGGGKEGITEVYDDLGKTVFGDYLHVDPGNTLTLSYTYKLPFTISLQDHPTYAILIQKQPGTVALQLDEDIVFDASTIEPLKAQGELQLKNRNDIGVSYKMDTDKTYSVTFKKHDVL